MMTTESVPPETPDLHETETTEPTKTKTLSTLLLSRDLEGDVYKCEPEDLRFMGAVPRVLTNTGMTPVIGHHYFLCVHTTDRWTVWTPTFSRDIGCRRVLIPNDQKIGVERWLEMSTYVDIRQLWIAPHGVFPQCAISNHFMAVTPSSLPDVLVDNALHALSLCLSGE